MALGLLEETGLSVTIANNGQEALEKLENADFNLVLMDMQMPVMDGITATKHIRTNGRWKNLPIVAMTANAMATDIERCLQVGMNGHLSKPIEVDKFYQVLKQFLKSTNTAPQNNHTIDTASLLNEVITVSQSDLPTLTGIDLEQAIFRIGGIENAILKSCAILLIAKNKNWRAYRV